MVGKMVQSIVKKESNHLIVVGILESLDDPLSITVKDFVVEHLGDVARVDTQGDGRVNEGHLRGVILKDSKILLK